VGQADSGPALLSGPGLARTKKRIVGPSPAQLVGSAQPSPPNIILYLIMYLYYLYIFIDIKKIKNSEKSLNNWLIFLHIFIKIV
jgi:hypothetical protein